MLFSLGQGKSRMVAGGQGEGFYVVKVNRIIPGNALTQPTIITQTQQQMQDALNQLSAGNPALRIELGADNRNRGIFGPRTDAAVHRFDLAAHVRLGDVDALTARRTEQRVVVERGDGGHSSLAHQPGVGNRLALEWGVYPTTMPTAGTVDEIAETLRTRRDKYGFSYIVVHEGEMDEFAGVVDLVGMRALTWDGGHTTNSVPANLEVEAQRRRHP